MTFNRKTGTEIKTLVGQCSVCNRKKSIIVSDNSIQAEGLGSFLKIGEGFLIELVKQLQPMY